MKRKKGLVSFIIILLFSTIIFFLGWTQFYVPIGKYGVLVSKTSGVLNEVITNGSLLWRWEKLLPTNTKTLLFSVKPVHFSEIREGYLPSAEIYSSLLDGRPDFSYNIQLESYLSIKPETLPTLVSTLHIENDNDLSLYLENQNEKLITMLIETLLTSKVDNELFYFKENTKELLQQINAAVVFPDLVISEIKVNKLKFPDFELYLTGKETYINYQKNLKDSLSIVTKQESTITASDYLQIERLGKLGQVLQSYPILIDFLAISRENASEAYNILEFMRNTKNKE